MITLQTNTFRIDEIESNGKERSFLLTVKNKPYKINELLFLVLDGIINKSSQQEIMERLNQVSTIGFSTADVETIIEKKLRPLGIFDDPTEVEQEKIMPLSGAIYFRKKLLAIESYEWILKGIKYFFTPWFFVPVFILAAGANIYWMRELLALESYVTAYNQQVASTDCMRGFQYLFSFYPIIISILLIHEFGHAAASYLFGVKPRDIGFGLYIIFPVLYTDVTDIWRLNKWKRTVVNFGGIYFQLLINLGLIYWISESSDFETISVLRFLIQLNVGTMLINLIPFLKFDGYWIYSDIFSLPNLKQQSSAYFVKFLNKVAPKIPVRISPNLETILNLKNPFLIIYSIGRYVFLVYFFYWAFAFTYKILMGYPSVISSLITDFSVCTVEPFVKSSITLGLFAYISSGYTKISHKYIKNSIQKFLNK